MIFILGSTNLWRLTLTLKIVFSSTIPTAGVKILLEVWLVLI